VARKRDDSALFDVPVKGRGRVERAVDEAVRKARGERTIDALDSGMVSLARACARAVDVAEAGRDVWALARAAGELRETLVRLRLDPTSRGLSRDSIADWLADLARPSTATDPASAGEMGDPADPG
jgi:hypothetical protein